MPHVLVVEDRPDILTMMRLALEEYGAYRVSCSANGDEALLLLEDELPDVMVIDVLLPDMPGLELAAHAFRRGIPLVLMTGEPGMAATLRDLEWPHLEKPFRLERLLEEIRGAIEDRSDNRRVVGAALERLVVRGEAAAPLLRRVRTVMEAA